jgi:uncharacterized protein (UPF0332 family)
MKELDLLLLRSKENITAGKILIREQLPNIAAARGYYAMFYLAEALLLTRGLSFTSHSAVIAAFGKEYARTGTLDPKFHRYLIAAQDTRQIGDYVIEKNITSDQATEIIAWAEEFLSVVEDYLK